MSTEQENFDDIFKSKLSEADFEFNEANWDKAEALILQANQKRKRKRIAIIFFVGLILGICIMMPFVGGLKEPVKKDLLTKKTNNNVAKNEESEQATNTVTKNDERVTDTVTPENGTKNATDKNRVEEATKPEINSVRKEEKSTIYNEVVHKNKAKETSRDKNITQTKQQEGRSKAKEGAQSNLTSYAEQGIHTAKKEEMQPLVLNSKGDVHSKGSKTKNGKTAGVDKQKGRNVSQTDNLSTNTSTTQAKEPGVTPITNTLGTINSDIGVKNDPVVDQVTDSIHVATIATNNTIKDSLVVANDTLIKKGAVVAPPSKENEPVTKKENVKQATFISVDAGTNYSFGWANNSTKEANGFNAIAGLSVTHYFTAKWSILIGLQYNSLAHLNYSSFTSSTTQYDFGFNTSSTTITPKMLHYIAVPIKLQHHFNEKNSLSLGFNLLYLVNTSSNVDSYTQNSLGSAKHIITTKAGYMDGFSTLDIQPALAYRRRIYKNLDISAEAYYGLIDIKNNATFGIHKTETNSGLKLTLSYNFK